MISSKLIPDLRERLYITVSTRCNLRCRFCASSKTSLAKQVMPDELFFKIVNKACGFGFSIFNVTPMIGEVFTDPGFLNKLDFLEAHPGVDKFAFCTNLTLDCAEFIRSIARFQKLQVLSISIYGYDEQSFERLTRTRPYYFRKMIENLEQIASWDPKDIGRLEIRLRSERSFSLEACIPELSDVLARLQANNARIRIVTNSYSNWGGLISEKDLEGLDISLKPLVPKLEPCSFLFYKPTVLPDGRINACSAEDGNASMVIGDLTRQSFREIYSRDNQKVRDLVGQQTQGQFSDVCQRCCGYHSILEDNYTYAYHKRPFIRLDQFFDQFDAEGPSNG